MKAALLGAAALITITTSASSDIITVTITGTVAPYTWNGSTFTSNPLIDNGSFGHRGDNLFGDAYTATWTVNTGCVTCNYVVGGQNASSPPSPILSTFLTINGTTVNFGTGGFGGIYDYHNQSSTSSITVNHGRFDAFYINTTIAPGGNAMNGFVDSFGGSFTGNVNTPWTYTFNPLIDNLDYSHQIGGSFNYGGLYGYLAPETFTITNQTQLAAVPFPVVGGGLPGLLGLLLLRFLTRRRA